MADPTTVDGRPVLAGAAQPVEIMNAGVPITLQTPTVAVPVSGPVTPSTSAAGLSVYRNLDLGLTGQLVKVTAGALYGWYWSNAAAAVRYLKIYNKATAPTQADTPVLTLELPATSAANLLSAIGIPFSAGISVRASNVAADNDTTAPTSGDVKVNLFYV